jgi:predicted metalloendopeptidase
MPDEGYYNVTGSWARGGAENAQSSRLSKAKLHEGQEKYMEYMRSLNELSGSSREEAERIVQQMMDFETMLAQWRVEEPPIAHAWGPELTSLSDLTAAYPGVPWQDLFEKIAEDCRSFNFTCNEKLLADEKIIINSAPMFFNHISDAIQNETMLNTSWKPLLRTHYIAMAKTALSKDFEDAGKVLDAWNAGVKQYGARAQHCFSSIVSSLPGLTDMAYLKEYFTPKVQIEAESMMNALKESFIERLKTVDWMDDETRAVALVKAERLMIHIGGGYQDLCHFPVINTTYFDNCKYAVHCHLVHRFIKLGEPVDWNSFSSPAHTVNAWYDNGLNAVFIPAGILQPPFFSDRFPPEQNFGTLGMVMGHEITHGFDSKGSLIDQDRRRLEWWSESVRESFDDKAHCIRQLYDNFQIGDQHVNGANTLGVGGA